MPADAENALHVAAQTLDKRDLRAALRACRIELRTGWRFKIWRSAERLGGCLAMLRERIRSIGWPRDPAAWLVWAFKSGGSDPPAALQRVRREQKPVALADLGLDLGAFKVPGPKRMTDLERFQAGLSGI